MPSYDIDAVLRHFGVFGRYHATIYMWLSFPWISAAWNMMAMSFYDVLPDHTCRFKPNDSDVTGLLSNISENSCSISGVDRMTNEHVEIVCGTNNTYIHFNPDYGNTIMTEWNLACDFSKTVLGGTAGMFYMLGYLNAALLSTWFADHFGRKPAMLTVLWVQIPISFGIYYAPNYAAYAFFRHLNGFVDSGYALPSFAMVSELTPDRWRTYSSLIPFICWVIGYVTLGVMAYYIRNWRTIQLIIASTTFFHLLFYWPIRESMVWLNARGHQEKLEDEIEYASRVNKKPVKLVEFQLTKTEKDEVDAVKKPSMTESIKKLAKSPVLVLYSFIFCYLWATASFVYYGLSLFSTSVVSNRYLSFSLSGFIELPSYILTYILLDRCGRKSTMILCYALAGVSLIAFACLPGAQTYDWILLMLSLVGKSAIASAFLGAYAYTAEVYPTVVRTVGMGISSFAARVSSLLAPYVGLLTNIDKRLPPAVFGTMSMIAAILIIVLPETNKEALPDYPEDVKTSNLLKRFAGKHANEERNGVKEPMVQQSGKTSESTFNVKLLPDQNKGILRASEPSDDLLSSDIEFTQTCDHNPLC